MYQSSMKNRKSNYQYLQLDVPLAATRSAPTMTEFIRPAFIKAAAAESATRVAGILSCTNSKAVNLDPCN